MTDADIKSFMKGSVNLGKHSGVEFQQELGMIWHPLDYADTGFKRNISIYYETHSTPNTYVKKDLLKYRKMAEKKKGYFFHISGDKKDYIGFRKKAWNDVNDIFYDLIDYFEEEQEEEE